MIPKLKCIEFLYAGLKGGHFCFLFLPVRYAICNWRASETLSGVTQSGCLFVIVILYFDPLVFCVRWVFDPVPNFTKQNPLVYKSLPVSP